MFATPAACDQVLAVGAELIRVELEAQRAQPNAQWAAQRGHLTLS